MVRSIQSISYHAGTTADGSYLGKVVNTMTSDVLHITLPNPFSADITCSTTISCKLHLTKR